MYQKVAGQKVAAAAAGSPGTSCLRTVAPFRIAAGNKKSIVSNKKSLQLLPVHLVPAAARIAAGISCAGCWFLVSGSLQLRRVPAARPLCGLLPAAGFSLVFLPVKKESPCSCPFCQSAGVSSGRCGLRPVHLVPAAPGLLNCRQYLRPQICKLLRLYQIKPACCVYCAAYLCKAPI